MRSGVQAGSISTRALALPSALSAVAMSFGGWVVAMERRCAFTSSVSFWGAMKICALPLAGTIT